MNRFFLYFILILNITSSELVFGDDTQATENAFTKLVKGNYPKVLILIISSDDKPVYVELQKLWRSYMHTCPTNVEAYFIKGNPNLTNLFKIEKDVIWSKTEESLIPGILNKTIISMEAMLPRLNEFDYVLRTNLSSFFVFDRMLKFLKGLPRHNCYCGSIREFDSIYYIEGMGIYLSKDVVKEMVKEKNELLNQTWMFDDVVLGKFFQNRSLIYLPVKRIDITKIETWKNMRGKIPNDGFFFRLKNDDPDLRASDEVYVYKQMLRKFYGISIN